MSSFSTADPPTVTTTATTASVVVCESASEDVPRQLALEIARHASEAVASRGAFSIALSGGSLPMQLAALADASASGVNNPHFEKWHVVLADERIVPTSNPDSNLGSLQRHFLEKVPIPPSNIHGLDATLVSSGTADDVARHYEAVVQEALAFTGGVLDLAVLGFGPDGHTCSLFPNHALLDERDRWVAPIEDSPKPPPRRVTLTFPVLNQRTRHALFCGTGPSKAPILRNVFTSLSPSPPAGDDAAVKYTARLAEPPPYPCAAVRPPAPGSGGCDGAAVTWVVDRDAVEGVPHGIP